LASLIGWNSFAEASLALVIWVVRAMAATSGENNVLAIVRYTEGMGYVLNRHFCLSVNIPAPRYSFIQIICPIRPS
jgi:hypothetical protein